jgi:hypothetical protein
MDLSIPGLLFRSGLGRRVLQDVFELRVLACHAEELGGDLFAMGLIRIPIILQPLFLIRGEFRDRDFGQ